MHPERGRDHGRECDALRSGGRTNAAGGGGAWSSSYADRRVAQITDAFTTIDGTAYDSTLRVPPRTPLR